MAEKKKPAPKKKAAAKKKTPAKKKQEALKSADPSAEVTLNCGANSVKAKGLVGLPISEAMKKYKVELNIPGTKVRILIGGDDKKRTDLLKKDDVVDFLRESGSKG